MGKRTCGTAVAIALACTAAAAQGQGGSTAAGQVTPPFAEAAREPRREAGTLAAERQFIREAVAAGQLETATARLAIQETGDEAVRAFAYRILDDHTSLQRRLRDLARSRGITVALAPTDEQLERVHRMRSLRQESFDREFLARIGVDSHRRSIDLYRGFLRSGSGDGGLREFARRALPVLEGHLRAAQQLHAGADRGERADAREQIREAVQVVQRMKSDPQLVQLLERAYGVFILTDYGRAALGVGAQGGEGVLVVRESSGRFGNPVFYDMGGLSVGAQGGASAGEVAFLLMTERAVQRFRSERNFSLHADAGLTLAAYSGRGHAAAGKLSDVVVWSGTRGAYAGIALGVSDIVVDREANRAYYGRSDASVLQILAGRIENPHHNVLGRVLGV